jgi:hypothetical protein
MHCLLTEMYCFSSSIQLKIQNLIFKTLSIISVYLSYFHNMFPAYMDENKN